MNAEKTGAFIRALRKETMLTQQQLAERLHVSDKAVSRWETGRGFPDIGNLEDLAEALGVSVAELLKGERFPAQITERDLTEASSTSFSVARHFVTRERWKNLAIGFVVGMVILLLAGIHLTSPIYIQNAENALTIDVLSGREVVAVMKDRVAGYEISDTVDPDTHARCRFISCYETVWERLWGNKNKTIISLGDQEQLDYIYYYPSDGADQLIWKHDRLREPDGGVISLPRLVYNYWILLGAVCSLIGIAVCVVCRKKYFFETCVKVAMIPIALTVSTVSVLAERFEAVYNAAYYLTGILLLAGALYALFRILFHAYRTKRTKS